MPTFRAEKLEQLATAIFQQAGAPKEHAECVASHLVESNLAGHDSHGVLRIPQYVDQIDAGRLTPDASMQVVSQSGVCAVVDGRGGFGQVIARDAMRLAIELARSVGLGAVAVRNCTHTGRIGTYTAMAAQQGMVGIATVNTGGGGQSVAPFGGTGRRLSTNPISIAAPTDGPRPILLDMATSVAPEGKVRARYQAGKPLPAGWLIDSQGQPTTDPADFYHDPVGALLPLGGPVGYKGFGLGFMIDILAGALSGAGCCEVPSPPLSDAMLAIAIDVTRFTPLDDFKRRVAGLTRFVKSSPTAPGYEEVFVPGEVEARTRERRLAEGIPVEQGTWELIDRIRVRFGLDDPAK
jgi:hydroxycarboxylate dehydrogenase B